MIMYLVYINNVSNAAEGTNDPQIALLTSDKEKAEAKFRELVQTIKEDNQAFVDYLYGEKDVNANSYSCMIFWRKPENWDWYSEICVVKLNPEEDYMPIL